MYCKAKKKKFGVIWNFLKFPRLLLCLHELFHLPFFWYVMDQMYLLLRENLFFGYLLYIFQGFIPLFVPHSLVDVVLRDHEESLASFWDLICIYLFDHNSSSASSFSWPKCIMWEMLQCIICNVLSNYQKCVNIYVQLYRLLEKIATNGDLSIDFDKR